LDNQEDILLISIAIVFAQMLFSRAFSFALFATAWSRSVNPNEECAFNCAQCNVVRIVVTVLRKEAGKSLFCSSLLHISGARNTATATVNSTLNVVTATTNLITSTQSSRDVVTTTRPVF
jgi:hypothetical protein